MLKKYLSIAVSILILLNISLPIFAEDINNKEYSNQQKNIDLDLYTKDSDKGHLTVEYVCTKYY